MHNPLDEPTLPTPRSVTPDPTSEPQEEPHKPLAIEPPPSEPGDQTDIKDDDEGEITTLDLGEGNVVKLDRLGPMIINSDGTLSRIQNWQDLHPIEQERTVRLLVKKRNVVRLQKLATEEEHNEAKRKEDKSRNGGEDFEAEGTKQEEELSLLQESRQQEANK
ncbi:hypothetical protein IAT40_005198 [Kwoniella sp. CBS 6097]